MATNTIQLLLQRPTPTHDVVWLQDALQAAIQLELATLPPYLSALFSIADQTSTAFNFVNDIVFNEMTLFGLACNLLAATAGALTATRPSPRSSIRVGGPHGTINTDPFRIASMDFRQ